MEMLDTAVFNDFTIRTFKVAAVSITQLRKLFMSLSQHFSLRCVPYGQFVRINFQMIYKCSV